VPKAGLPAASWTCLSQAGLPAEGKFYSRRRALTPSHGMG